MSSTTLVNPRKPLFWLLGLAAAAAFFASGALVARATIDDDDDSSNQGRVVTPGIASGEAGAGISPNTPASYGTNDVKTDGGRGASPVAGMDASYPACQAPMPAGVVTPAGIDPAKAGFNPAFPGAGFSALSVSLSSIGECDKSGSAKTGELQLDSSWIHDATGLQAYVSQRKSDDRVASVLREDSATFWADGYVFQVGVNAYRILPVAADGPATSTGAGASPSAEPRIAAPTPDARATEVLQQLIAQLSSSAELKCFWTLGKGDWSSLAGLGIGDPRTAVPSGFTQQEFNVTAFTPPADGCDTSVKPNEGFNFNAGWQKQDNGFSYIGVSVYGTGRSESYPGQISEHGANWMNNGLQFGVYAKSEKPLGIELVRALAKALDPNFSEACLIRERQLTDADLPGLGFSRAKAPAGYSLDGASMVASEIGAGCAKPEGWEPSYSLNWTFTKGADVINASANRYGSSQTGDGSGYQSTNSLSWVSANGTNYSVNAYSRGINQTVPKEDLVAVAKSIDPAFDISKLKEEAGGGAKPMPADLPERSAR